MEKLVILSDLWGKMKSDWLVEYSSILKNNFELVYYDCRVLGEIDIHSTSEDVIHQQFINGGIETAVKDLLKKETGKVNILGFSIGGYIAWKAALEGLKISNLIAVSATRLRFENSKPLCKITLIYGALDTFQPSIDWYNRLELDKIIYADENHDLYTKPENARRISDLTLKQGVICTKT